MTGTPRVRFDGSLQGISSPLTAVSLFAGVGGFELGLQAAGIRTVASVEIDPAARGVLAHRFPHVRLFDDVTKVTADDLHRAGFVGDRGVITGGFPCQDVSIAGRRAGLAGARSGLFFDAARLIEATRARWFIIENVPGLLSSNSGRDMGTVLGTLVDLGYGVAYRVLDSRFFGVAQRRRRVFIVGCLGDDGTASSAVLAVAEGSGGHLGEGDAEGEASAASLGVSFTGGRGVVAESGVVTALSASLGAGGPDAAHAQAGWLIPWRAR